MRLLGTVVRISRGKDCCNVENIDSIWKDFNQPFYLRGNTLGCSANLNCPILLPADCMPGWLCLCRLPTLTGSSCQKLHCTLSTRSLSTFTVLHQDRTEIYFPFTGGEPWGFCCFETRSHCVAGSICLSLARVGKKLGSTVGLEVCTTTPWGEATLCFEEVKYLPKVS